MEGGGEGALGTSPGQNYFWFRQISARHNITNRWPPVVNIMRMMWLPSAQFARLPIFFLLCLDQFTASMFAIFWCQNIHPLVRHLKYITVATIPVAPTSDGSVLVHRNQHPSSEPLLRPPDEPLARGGATSRCKKSVRVDALATGEMRGCMTWHESKWAVQHTKSKKVRCLKKLWKSSGQAGNFLLTPSLNWRDYSWKILGGVLISINNFWAE